jgi:TPR repeat protein
MALQSESTYFESDAWHSKTQEFWDNGQYRLAFRRWLAGARRGDMTAQLNLGYFYDCGLGVEKSGSKALRWYKRAHKQGHAAAASNAGTVYRDRGEFQTALTWFERAVAFGDIGTHWEIARMYFRQRKDIPSTIRHLRATIQGKPRVDVTRWSFEAANRLLWRLERRKAA